ncbi:MAG: ABC transporter permease [Capsulimonadaceae bacterium]
MLSLSILTGGEIRPDRPPPSTRETIVISQALANRSFVEEVRELWGYRSLIWSMIERDLRVRYKNSVLGIFWSMINPLAQAAILTIVLSYILNVGPKNNSAFILCALVPWLFFNSAILDSSQAVLSQINLVKKVYFPREVVIIATVGANLIHLLISISVFVFYRWCLLTLAFHKWPGLPPHAIVFLPIVLLVLVSLTLGISFIVSAVNVFYEDTKFIVTILLQFLMYLSPIMYFAEMVFWSPRIPVHLRWILYHLYLLNPEAWSISAFKQMFFYSVPVPMAGVRPIPGGHVRMTATFDWRYMLIDLCISLVICGVGYSMFNKAKWRFAERP